MREREGEGEAEGERKGRTPRARARGCSHTSHPLIVAGKLNQAMRCTDAQTQAFIT